MPTNFFPLRGLYAITPETSNSVQLLSQAAAALHGGALTLQYRAKQLPPAQRLEQAQALSALCHEQGARLIINDDVSLALACGADGVHLGREDGSIANALARDTQHQLMLGVSCCNSLQLAVGAQAAGAHYVAFGSFFTSRTKPDAVQAPISLLAAAHHALHIPIVAIGGITLHNVDQLIKAGADAVAVISALFDAPDIAATAAQFQHYFQEPYEQPQRSTV